MGLIFNKNSCFSGKEKPNKTEFSGILSKKKRIRQHISARAYFYAPTYAHIHSVLLEQMYQGCFLVGWSLFGLSDHSAKLFAAMSNNIIVTVVTICSLKN